MNSCRHEISYRFEKSVMKIVFNAFWEILKFQVYTIFLLKFIFLFIQKKNDYNFMLIYYMKKLFVHKDNLIGLLKSEKADYAEQRDKCYRISYMNPVE